VKSKSFVLFLALLLPAALFAKDPMPGGQSLFLYGHPKFIVTANSAAGGAIFSEGSYSLNMNPALTGGLQCPAADLGYTALQQLDGSDSGHGGAVHLGIAVPSRLGVFSGGANINFLEIGEAPLGNGGTARIGWARDVTRNLSLGFAVIGGYLVYDDLNDFFVGADLGVWYRIEQIAFLRNVRFAVVMQNMGKPYQLTESLDFYPGIFTPKAGVAASLIDIDKKFVLGLSADLSFPTVSNLLFNAGLQVEIVDIVYVSAGWDFNAREFDAYEDKSLHLPFVGVGVRFSLNTSGSELMRKRGFNETTLDVDAVWQRYNSDFHLVSAGAAARFGVEDVLPPVISVDENRIRYDQ
jgi:hypothetical protein